MTAAEIIGQVLDAGGQIAADGPDLVLTAPRPLAPDLLDQLKGHKHAILEELAARAPVNLDEVLAGACAGQGITPAVFRSLLSHEDLQDIAAGDIHRKTLGAYAESFAEGMRSGRIGARPSPSAMPSTNARLGQTKPPRWKVTRGRATMRPC